MSILFNCFFEADRSGGTTEVSIFHQLFGNVSVQLGEVDTGDQERAQERRGCSPDQVIRLVILSQFCAVPIGLLEGW
jgi:hypothetical protein